MDEATRRLLDQAAAKDPTKERRRIRFTVEVEATEDLIGWLQGATDEILLGLRSIDEPRAKDFSSRLEPHREEFMQLAMMGFGMKMLEDAVLVLGTEKHLRLNQQVLDGSAIVASDDGGSIIATIRDVVAL